MMAYETEMFLVDAAPCNTKSVARADYIHNDAIVADIPQDATIVGGGVVVGQLKLGELGFCSNADYLPPLTQLASVADDEAELISAASLAIYFGDNRQKQKETNRYVDLVWSWTTSECQEKYPDLLDPYGDPYVLHDAEQTLQCIRGELYRSKCRNELPYRRFVMAEAILAPFVEHFQHAAIVTRGY